MGAVALAGLAALMTRTVPRYTGHVALEVTGTMIETDEDAADAVMRVSSRATNLGLLERVASLPDVLASPLAEELARRDQWGAGEVHASAIAAELADRITVRPLTGSRVVQIELSSRDPGDIPVILNAIVDHVVEDETRHVRTGATAAIKTLDAVIRPLEERRYGHESEIDSLLRATRLPLAVPGAMEAVLLLLAEEALRLELDTGAHRFSTAARDHERPGRRGLMPLEHPDEDLPLLGQAAHVPASAPPDLGTIRLQAVLDRMLEANLAVESLDAARRRIAEFDERILPLRRRQDIQHAVLADPQAFLPVRMLHRAHRPEEPDSFVGIAAAVGAVLGAIVVLLLVPGRRKAAARTASVA